MKINHDLHPELNKGPAYLQSAALTTELCTPLVLHPALGSVSRAKTTTTICVSIINIARLRHQLTTNVTRSRVILAHMCVKLLVRSFVCHCVGPFWVHFGSISGPFWVHFGSILGHFGSILGPFGVHLESIWSSFCLLSEC